MDKKRYYAGIDIGGTKIAGALATAKGRIISRARTPTPKNALPRKILSTVVDLLEEMLDDVDLGKKNLAAVGIGVPGIVDAATGKVVRTSNMRLSGFDLRKKMEKALKVKCAIGNDANLGTIGEKWLGAAKDEKNVVGLFIGTGVGAGLVIDGRLVTGRHGAAAELGHMTIQDDGPACSCGNIGCLEALTGRWAIERDIRQAIKKGKKSVITKYLVKKTDTIKSKMLSKALKRHDGVVARVLSEASRQLGVACVSVRHIFDPDVIVLGGGVIEACGDFMLPIVKKTVGKDKLFSDIGKCKIVASKLGDDAIVLGAVVLAQNLA
jgi:glucokinase